jgi:hypothetical protein
MNFCRSAERLDGPKGSGEHLFGDYSELKGIAFTFAKRAAKRAIWFATVPI